MSKGSSVMERGAFERNFSLLEAERWKKLPWASRLENAGISMTEVSDEEIQQEAIQATCMEMILDPGDAYKASDRLRAVAELAKIKGYGKEQQMKRVGEQIRMIQEKLREQKAVPVKVTKATEP